MSLPHTLDDESRRAGALKSLSLGVLGTAAIGELANLIMWRGNPQFIILPATLTVVGLAGMSIVTLWLVRRHRVRFASYLFTSSLALLAAASTYIFSPLTGPMAVTFLFPIVAASMVISTVAGFHMATLSAVLYVADIWLYRTGLVPRLAAAEDASVAIPYMAVTIHLLFFYLLAFMSWYAARELSQALDGTRRYAVELQKANEELRASEEELRASNEELRAIEEELRAANEELRASNDELKNAQEKLVRTEKLAAIGQLAGGVGHELRNPLGAIKNAAYYVKGKVSGSELAQREPRVVQFLNLMEDEINSANKIISDLLGFSRVGKPAVSPARIERVIDSAISRVAIPPGIELVREMNGDLPIIEIDSDQIQQVMVNLITNAVQAMPEGGKLTVGARKNGSFLDIAVADTGVGMSPEVKDRIFAPLFTTKAKGIGLGLAVSKGITERHGGLISVVSEAGKGATFTVRLPLGTEATNGKN